MCTSCLEGGRGCGGKTVSAVPPLQRFGQPTHLEQPRSSRWSARWLRPARRAISRSRSTCSRSSRRLPRPPLGAREARCVPADVRERLSLRCTLSQMPMGALKDRASFRAAADFL